MDKQRLSFRLSTDDYNRFNEFCERQEMSQAQVMRKALQWAMTHPEQILIKM